MLDYLMKSEVLRELQIEKHAGEDVESILDELFELWIDQDPVCDENIRQLYRELGECIGELSVAQSDRVSNILADLCVAYSRGAFMDGARTAGSLIREILFEK